MATTLLRTYFSGESMSPPPAVLAEAATDVGFDAKAVDALIAEDAYSDTVRESQQRAQRQGITGVPCYVFGRQHAVMGAQSVEASTEALDAVSG